MDTARTKAERMLVLYGTTEKAPEYAIKIGAVERSLFQRLIGKVPNVKVLRFTADNTAGDQAILTDIVMFSSVNDPTRAKWIVISPERVQNKFVLTLEGKALTFEDSGLKDRVDKPRPDNFFPADEAYGHYNRLLEHLKNRFEAKAP